MSAPLDFWQRYYHMFFRSSALRVGKASHSKRPKVQGGHLCQCLATGMWLCWEWCGLGSGSSGLLSNRNCPEESTPIATMMKGALLVLAFLVTWELTFKMCEGGKEGPDDPPDPCLLLSHCILPSPVQAASRGRFRGKLADQCQGVLHKLLRLSVFEWRRWCGAGRFINCAHCGR